MVRVLSISTGTRWTTFRHCPFNAFKHCHISQMSSSRISFLKIIIAKKLCNNLFLNIILKMSLVIRMVEQQQCSLLLLLWGGGVVLTHPLVCVAHADAWRWVSMGLTPGTPLHPYIRGVAAGGRNGPPPPTPPPPLKNPTEDSSCCCSGWRSAPSPSPTVNPYRTVPVWESEPPPPSDAYINIKVLII